MGMPHAFVGHLWLSTEVWKLVELVKRPRYFTCAKVVSTVSQPIAYALWLFDLALVPCCAVVASLDLGMLGPVVPCTVAAWNNIAPVLAILLALI